MKSFDRSFRLLLLVMPLLFSSCITDLFGSDDDDGPTAESINNQLQGDWQMISWTGDNDVAVIPDGIAFWKLTFDADDGTEGEVIWEIVSNLPDIIESGEYLVDYEVLDGATLEMGNTEYDIVIDGDRMTLDNDDGNRVLVKND